MEAGRRTPPERTDRALSAAEERFRALTEGSAELIAVLDADGIYQYVSPQFERELGLDESELLGSSALDWIHPDDRPTVVSRYQQAIASGRSEKAVYRMRDRQGRWRWLSGSATPFLTGHSDRRLIAACRDITREMALHDQLQSLRDLEYRVAELSRYFLSLPPHQLAGEVRAHVRTAAEIAGADHTVLYLVDPADPTRVVGQQAWPEPEPGSRFAELRLEQTAGFRQAAGQLLRGEILHVPDAAAIGSNEDRAAARSRGLRSSLTVPLRCGERILGFHVYECRSSEKRWSEEEITLLRLLGEICAVALERERREAAMRESEARFRALTDHLGDLIFELDERGRMLYAGKRFQEHLGRPSERLVGLPLVELVHPDDRQLAETALLSSQLEDDPSQGSFRVLRREGTALWVEASSRAFRSAAGDLHFACVARDVTEHRAEVESLECQQRSEQKLSELYRRFLDLRGDAIDDGIREGLEQVTLLTGADRAALTTDFGPTRVVVSTGEWSAGGTASSEDGALQHFQGGGALRRVLRGEVLVVPDTALIGEEMGPTRDRMRGRGARAVLGVPVLQGGRLIAYLSLECTRGPRAWSDREIAHARRAAELFTSALQRTRAEDDLRRRLDAQRRVVELSNRLLAAHGSELEEAVIDALATTAGLFGAQRGFILSFGNETQAPVGIRHGDLPWGQLEWCERAEQAAVIGVHPYAVDRILQQGFLLAPEVDDMDVDAEPLRRAMAERDVRSVLCVALRSGQRLNGILAIEAIGEPRSWGERELAQLETIGAFFASTLERLQTEVALRDGQTQMLHAQKMEAVGRLAGGIAHDFNNILTVILGFSRALLREAEPDSEFREDIQEIHDSAERAAGLTRQLLTFSRRQPQQSEAVPLNEVVRGLERLLRRILGEDVELVLELSEAVGSVRGDAAQLEQVIVNLGVNARDAMPEGGTLRIRTRQQVLEPGDARRLGLPAGADFAILEIADTGEGIADSAREHIFEPFYTTKDPGKGTGLGLAIVYSVANDAGGTVELESEPGKGACFSVYLPLSESDGPELRTADPIPRQAPSATILLVEDELSVRRLVRRVLQAEGYDVLEATDGQAALELLRDGELRIDLLITDVVMPGIGGLELARELEALRPDTPVLFVSGYPQERGGASVALPGERFLQKPFGDVELLDRVGTMIRAARGQGAAGERRP